MKASVNFTWLLFAVSAAIVLMAATYRLSESPAVWYDEGFYTQASINLAQHGVQELQIAPGTFVSTSYVTVGYPLLLPVSWSYRLFGVGVLQGRAVMVIFIIGFVVAACAYVYLLFGERYAAWTALLLASFPILYGDGKSVLGEVPGMFFLLLFFIALLKLERSAYQNMWGYAAVGLAAGLCIVTKPIFILLLPALAVAWVIRHRSITIRWGGFALAALVFLLPVLLWLHMQFGGDSSLASIVGEYASPYQGFSIGSLLVQNILRFFTESTPIYTAATILLWCASFFFRKKRGIEITNAEITALLFCAAILAAYLRLVGWYRYFFPAEILALLFVPYSLAAVFAGIHERLVFLRKARWVPYAIVALLASGQLYQLARSSYVAGYYDSTNSRDLETAFASFGAQSSIFLYNVPELAVFLKTPNYYQYLAPSPYVIGAQELPALQSGEAQYVVVSQSAYHINPQLFAQYVFLKSVGQYDFLQRN